MPTGDVGGLPDVPPDLMLKVNPIVSQPPSPEGYRALMQALQGVDPSSYRALTAALPNSWKMALGVR